MSFCSDVNHFGQVENYPSSVHFWSRKTSDDFYFNRYATESPGRSPLSAHTASTEDFYSGSRMPHRQAAIIGNFRLDKRSSVNHINYFRNSPTWKPKPIGGDPTEYLSRRSCQKGLLPSVVPFSIPFGWKNHQSQSFVNLNSTQIPCTGISSMGSLGGRVSRMFVRSTLGNKPQLL
jgi:hypothetical protein